MTAPPQVQAQSFAKAMRTDMMSHSSVAGVPLPTGFVSSFARLNEGKVQNKALRATAFERD